MKFLSFMILIASTQLLTAQEIGQKKEDESKAMGFAYKAIVPVKLDTEAIAKIMDLESSKKIMKKEKVGDNAFSRSLSSFGGTEEGFMSDSSVFRASIDEIVQSEEAKESDILKVLGSKTLVYENADKSCVVKIEFGRNLTHVPLMTVKDLKSLVKESNQLRVSTNVKLDKDNNGNALKPSIECEEEALAAIKADPEKYALQLQVMKVVSFEDYMKEMKKEMDEKVTLLNKNLKNLEYANYRYFEQDKESSLKSRVEKVEDTADSKETAGDTTIRE